MSGVNGYKCAIPLFILGLFVFTACEDARVDETDPSMEQAEILHHDLDSLERIANEVHLKSELLKEEIDSLYQENLP